MRPLSQTLLLCVLLLLPNSGSAGDERQDVALSGSEHLPDAGPNSEKYRGYFIDLTAIAERADFSKTSEALQRQIDIVENVGLSVRTRDFFRTVPIVADESACLESPGAAIACYGPYTRKDLQPATRELTVWNGSTSRWTNSNPLYLASDARGGIIMFRPRTLDEERPTLLHEFLHAYHRQVMPGGFQNSGIFYHYSAAKAKGLFSANAYLMSNAQEFFAVTGSIFLYGKDNQEPFTRANLKEKYPDYYKYLVWLFELDPDAPPKSSPVASAEGSSSVSAQ